MTPEDFEALDPAAQAAAIDKNNEEVRQWVTTCRKCGFRMIGTLRELRTMKCPNCTGN
jgi:predicted Zn-ribbon and HTH transcriptional regulator